MEELLVSTGTMPCTSPTQLGLGETDWQLELGCSETPAVLTYKWLGPCFRAIPGSVEVSSSSHVAVVAGVAEERGAAVRVEPEGVGEGPHSSEATRPAGAPQVRKSPTEPGDLVLRPRHWRARASPPKGTS